MCLNNSTIFFPSSAVFDFEENSVYDSLHVYANDGGSGAALFSEPSTIIIQINNVNDNPPIFNRNSSSK